MFEKIISKTPTESAPTPSAPPAPAHATTSAPASVRSPKVSGQRNVLLPDVEIKGTVRFKDALIVDGKIEGEINSAEGALTIGEPAKIKAEIKTRSVVVYGKVHGNIFATERVELKKDAEVLGDIKAAVLTMEAGATFVGNSTVGAAAQTQKSAPATPKGSQKNNGKPGQQGQQGQQGKLANVS